MNDSIESGPIWSEQRVTDEFDIGPGPRVELVGEREIGGHAGDVACGIEIPYCAPGQTALLRARGLL